jgi:hypothetical protein
MFLLDDILLAPLKLGKQMLEGIRDEVDKERLLTPESIKKELFKYQMKLDRGEISEAEYDKTEKWLLERLKAIQKSKGGE